MPYFPAGRVLSILSLPISGGAGLPTRVNRHTNGGASAAGMRPLPGRSLHPGSPLVRVEFTYLWRRRGWRPRLMTVPVVTADPTRTHRSADDWGRKCGNGG